MKGKKGKLAKIVGLTALVPGFFLVAMPALALKLQLQYPLIPGAKKTLNELVEDKVVNGTTVPAQFTIPDIFIFLFQAAIWIGVILAFFSLVYIGFRFATSGGDPIRLKGAKARLRGIAFGILVLIGSFLLLRLINPELTALRFAQQGVCAADKCKNPAGFDLDEETQNIGNSGGLTVYSENGFGGADRAVNILTDIPEARKQLVGSGGLESSGTGVLLGSLKLAPHCRIRLFEKKGYNEGGTAGFQFMEVVNDGKTGSAVSAHYQTQGQQVTLVVADSILIPLNESGTLLFSRIDDLEISDGNYWGDDVDSIDFMEDGSENMGCKQRNGVIFYENVETKNGVAQGAGRREAFWNSEEDFKTTFIGNDSASFMEVVGNVKLTIYENDQFGGSSRTYSFELPAYQTKGHDLSEEKWGVGANKDKTMTDQVSSLKISLPPSP